MSKRSRWVPLALALPLVALLTVPARADVVGRAHSRPFSDFLDAQGSLLRPDGRPVITGWIDESFSYLSVVDATGKLGAWIESHGGPTIGTTVRGTVMERELEDGTAEVVVNEEFTNAYAFTRSLAGLIVHGYPALELAGHPERQPVLAGGFLQIKFHLSSPGAPIPDLFQTEDQELSSLSFRAQAFGPLRAEFGVAEGTPGSTIVSQSGIFHTRSNGELDETGYAAEIVSVQVMGGSLAITPAAPAAATTAPPSTRTWGELKKLYGPSVRVTDR